MKPIDIAAAERAADEAWERQTEYSTTAEQRSKALYVALRAFQAALAIQGAGEVNDYLALCTLLGEALDEYGDALHDELPDDAPPPVH